MGQRFLRVSLLSAIPQLSSLLRISAQLQHQGRRPQLLQALTVVEVNHLHLTHLSRPINTICIIWRLLIRVERVLLAFCDRTKALMVTFLTINATLRFVFSIGYILHKIVDVLDK